MKTAILASIIALILVTFFIESRANDNSYIRYQYPELNYLQNRRALEEQEKQTEIMKDQLDQQEHQFNIEQTERAFERVIEQSNVQQ